MMIGHPSSPGLSLLLPCMHSILGLMSASATNNSAPVWPKQGSAQTATPHRVVKVTLQRHSNRKCVCVCVLHYCLTSQKHTPSSTGVCYQIYPSTSTVQQLSLDSVTRQWEVRACYTLLFTVEEYKSTGCHFKRWAKTLCTAHSGYLLHSSN